MHFVFRHQFGKPLAQNQLMQKKMADMTTEVNYIVNMFFIFTKMSIYVVYLNQFMALNQDF